MPTIENPPVSKPRYDLADMAIATYSGLILAMTAVFLCAVPFALKMAATRDFVAYYSAGRQLVSHADPYDAAAVYRIEHSSGFMVDGVLVMRNPPWTLPLACPLGFFEIRVAAVFWTLALLACFLVPIHLVRKLHGSPSNYVHWLGLSFAPALICLTMGQTSLFVLLGLTLFLYYNQAHPFAAGASLWLCSVKPHLLFPFAAVLLAWILFTRSYKILAGAAVTMAVSCALTLWIDPVAFHRYMELMRSPGVVQEFVPCLSDTFRFAINQRLVWLQYLPACIASAWALWFFWKRRHTWSWVENSALLILVSLVAAPYSFVYDQSVAIPAVLHGAYRTRKRLLLFLVVCMLGTIELETIWVRISTLYYVWTAPAWLLWYLIASTSANERVAEDQHLPAVSSV